MTIFLINLLSSLSLVTLVLGQNGEKFMYTGGFGFELITTTSLNQDYLPFRRNIELDHIKPLGHELQKAINSFHALCFKYRGDSKTRKQVKLNSMRSFFGLQPNTSYELGVTTSFFSPGSNTMAKGYQTCLDHGARLPEFRENAQEVIKHLCNKYNVSSIPVAVQVNNTNLVFPSDQSYIAYNPFSHVDIMLSQEHKYSLSGRISDEHLAELPKLTAIVDYCTSNTPNLRFRHPDPFKTRPIICEVDNPSNSDSDSSTTSVLQAWIENACTSDLKALEQQVELVIAEISSITNITMPFKSKPTTFDSDSDLKINFNQPLPNFIVPNTTTPSPPKSRFPRMSPFLYTIMAQKFQRKQTTTEFPQIPILTSHQPIDLDYLNFDFPPPVASATEQKDILSRFTRCSPFFNSLQDYGFNRKFLPHTTEEYGDPEPESPINCIPSDPQVAPNLTSSNSTENLDSEKMQAASFAEFAFWSGIIPTPLDNILTKDMKHKLRESVIGSVPNYQILDLQVVHFVNEALNFLTFDWNNILDTMLGDAPPLATAYQLLQVANAVKTIALNQAQIEHSIKHIEKTLINVHNKLNEHVYISTLYNAIQDVKANILLGTQVVTNFIAKLANIVLAAQLGQTSTYALNQHELTEIALLVRQMNSDIILTKNLHEIKTTLVHDGYKTLVLILEIPVTNKRNLFNIYKVIPVPKFNANATFMPHYEYSNLAVSVTDEYYTILTDIELNHCLQNPRSCKTNYPFWLAQDNQFHCIMSSFLMDTLACPMQLTHEKPTPFLYFSDLQLLYSVPDETQMDSVCVFPNLTSSQMNFGLYNSGIWPTLPNCKITFTGDHQTLVWFTPSNHPVRSISNWNTFNNLQLKFASNNVTVLMPSSIINTSPNLTLTSVHVPSWNEIFADAYHPNKSIPFSIMCVIIVIILIISAVIVRICCALGLFRCKCRPRTFRKRKRTRRPLPETPEDRRLNILIYKNEPRPDSPHITTTSNTADPTLTLPPLRTHTPNYPSFKPISFNIDEITQSLSNLDLVKIEETAFTPPLPKKRLKPSLDPINESYVEMAPLMMDPQKSTPSLDKIEQPTDESCIIIENTPTHVVYSVPSPRYKPRFQFSPSVMRSMEHISCDDAPAHV